LWETIDARKEGDARDGFFFDPFSEPIDMRFSLFLSMYISLCDVYLCVCN